MEFQIASPGFRHRRRQAAQFINLPHELLDKICSYIIPVDRIFTLLLADVSDANEDSTGRAPNGFFFDRGYGFPFFQTSFLRVHSRIYEICMLLWLRTSHFRLDMGEHLGPQVCACFVPDAFIRRIVHCELHIVVPFYPQKRLRVVGNVPGSWLMRRMLRRLLGWLDEGGNLREMRLSVRDNYAQDQYVSCADYVPRSLMFFANGPLLQPVIELIMALEGCDRVVVFKNETSLCWKTSPLPFIGQLNHAIERCLVTIAKSLSEDQDDDETGLAVFREECEVRTHNSNPWPRNAFPQMNTLLHEGTLSVILDF